jgi:hypothetical protein
MKLGLRLVLALFLVAAAGPSFAMKIFIDYDPNYDMDAVETFAWQETSDTSLKEHDPLMHSRLVNGIEHYITMAGVREVTENPDVYVTYHTSSKEELSLNTSNWGYGYPGGWHGGGYGGYYGRYYGAGYGGYGSSTTTVQQYQIGTLVVDIWDAKSETLVWRGTAAEITIVDNPKKMDKKLDKALKQIVAKSQKTQAKAGN